MKIAAVVVTHNRLELLKECIQSLRNQTHKIDAIFVINNSSTDGTFDWLNQQKDLTIITQENSGSAGGQHTGIKTAYEKGYDWIWCFDDDCIATDEALENLLKYASNGNLVLNSLVISNQDKNKLAFGFYDKQKDLVYRKKSEITEDVIPSANFFNGTLIKKEVIEKIGLPLIFLFIRGEELEYLIRIQEQGFKVLTVINSVVLHPPAIKKIFDNVFFRYEFLVLDSFKRYYTVRNLVYITKKYKSQKYLRLIKIVVLDFVVILSTLDIKNFVSEVKGIIDGLSLK